MIDLIRKCRVGVRRFLLCHSRSSGKTEGVFDPAEGVVIETYAAGLGLPFLSAANAAVTIPSTGTLRFTYAAAYGDVLPSSFSFLFLFFLLLPIPKIG